MPLLPKRFIWSIPLTLFISCAASLLVLGLKSIDEAHQRPIAPPRTPVTHVTCGDGLPISASRNTISPEVEAALGSNVKLRSENEYEVPRTELLTALDNTNELAVLARVVPRAQGFQLFSIRPDSPYTKIGMHNGDLVKRVNGHDLTRPETVLGMFTSLRKTSRIEIEIEREGSSLRKTLHIL